MRTTLLLAAVLLLTGCASNGVIQDKHYSATPFICNFTYNRTVDEKIIFEDSCTKYHIGDILPEAIK